MAQERSEKLSSIYYPLRITYGLVPILAGLDKFVGILADWEAYIPGYASDILPFSATTFMMIVGVVEVIVSWLAVQVEFSCAVLCENFCPG